MTVTSSALFEFDNSFVRELAGLYVDWRPAAVPDPTLLALNDELATELGIDPSTLGSADGVAVLAGNAVPVGAQRNGESALPATPVARRTARPGCRPLGSLAAG